MLLKSGADANLAMADGRTPIHIASESGNIGVIKLLLEKKDYAYGRPVGWLHILVGHVK